MLLALALTVSAVHYGRILWNGTAYPTADPDLVAERVQQQSQQVYDVLGLPASHRVESRDLDTGTCYARGLLDIEKVARGVVDVRHRWSVGGVSESAAVADGCGTR
ncbi:hypothetical protein ABZV31_09885 [Streptomyces sp. NPDC005202]|uniref:hypothetical protein n=1 Tax=Streptomyces sp. NPDC005202 TaxID=3157021 RepID=UPI0033BA59F9